VSKRRPIPQPEGKARESEEAPPSLEKAQAATEIVEGLL